LAEYLRFEVYIPRSYTERGVDEDGQPYEKRRYVDQEKLRRFLAATRRKFNGLTQANPYAPAALKGWWIPSEKAEPRTKQKRVDVVIDFLEYVYCLVPLYQDKEKQGLRHFTQWKKILEEDLGQDYVLVMYSSIQTIGDYI
jgi:hypothetical protein